MKGESRYQYVNVNTVILQMTANFRFDDCIQFLQSRALSFNETMSKSNPE